MSEGGEESVEICRLARMISSIEPLLIAVKAEAFPLLFFVVLSDGHW